LRGDAAACQRHSFTTARRHLRRNCRKRRTHGRRVQRRLLLVACHTRRRVWCGRRGRCLLRVVLGYGLLYEALYEPRLVHVQRQVLNHFTGNVARGVRIHVVLKSNTATSACSVYSNSM
jgi:hypothetical protein